MIGLQKEELWLGFILLIPQMLKNQTQLNFMNSKMILAEDQLAKM